MRKAKPEKLISTLLNESEACLKSLLLKAKQLNRLDHLLQAFLANSALQSHCHVVNWRAHSLVIATENASWCTLLRYEVPQLLKQYRQAGIHELQSITCQVQTPSEQKRKEHLRMNHPLLSEDNAKLLAEVASTIKYPRLRNALENIIKKSGLSP